MKSDREFIDGIYIKAEKLINEQNTSLDNKLQTNSVIWNSYKKWTPVLAACIILVIAIPIYLIVNPVNQQQPQPDGGVARTREGMSTPMTSDLYDETAEKGNAVYAPSESEVLGEITAVVEDNSSTYLLLKTTEIIEGFAPDTILMKCDNTLLLENGIQPVIGDKGKFKIEEQPVDVLKEEYNNRIKLKSNKNSEEQIEKAIQASEYGNGFIGYFNVKSIGEYYGI